MYWIIARKIEGCIAWLDGWNMVFHLLAQVWGRGPWLGVEGLVDLVFVLIYWSRSLAERVRFQSGIYCDRPKSCRCLCWDVVVLWNILWDVATMDSCIVLIFSDLRSMSFLTYHGVSVMVRKAMFCTVSSIFHEYLEISVPQAGPAYV